MDAYGDETGEWNSMLIPCYIAKYWTTARGGTYLYLDYIESKAELEDLDTTTPLGIE